MQEVCAIGRHLGLMKKNNVLNFKVTHFVRDNYLLCAATNDLKIYVVYKNQIVNVTNNSQSLKLHTMFITIHSHIMQNLLFSPVRSSQIFRRSHIKSLAISM